MLLLEQNMNSSVSAGHGMIRTLSSNGGLKVALSKKLKIVPFASYIIFGRTEIKFFESMTLLKPESMSIIRSNDLGFTNSRARSSDVFPYGSGYKSVNGVFLSS